MTMDLVQESLTLPVGNWAIHMLLIIIISQTCKLRMDVFALDFIIALNKEWLLHTDLSLPLSSSPSLSIFYFSLLFYYAFSQGTGGRTTQYTCCSSSTDCIDSCYCNDDDNVDYKRRRKRIDITCNHDDDVTIECGTCNLSVMEINVIFMELFAIYFYARHALVNDVEFLDFDVKEKEDAGTRDECDCKLKVEM